MTLDSSKSGVASTPPLKKATATLKPISAKTLVSAATSWRSKGSDNVIHLIDILSPRVQQYYRHQATVSQ